MIVNNLEECFVRKINARFWVGQKVARKDTHPAESYQRNPSGKTTATPIKMRLMKTPSPSSRDE